MLNIKRTDSANPDFQSLVKKLDAELAQRDGAEHSFFAQFNKIENIKHAVVFYEGNVIVACGAIKQYDTETMEVKRMYVLPERRGKGIASSVLKELEIWTKESGCSKCILETGKRQPEAISLYKKNNYVVIPNYGQYKNIDNSVCFQKEL
ncbi:MAG: GNAT family N-acetyltransferase [Bacteroidetes bacterium]|nr:GNAT family N-acetyltransferase [Bacteroidota bacterium]HNR19631.1 GNAT family N-acetyltransferase [Bacteroidia bacterium]HNU33110.1 GNAT family N-acetyltransferase [Bacteroidia bacterium]